MVVCISSICPVFQLIGSEMVRQLVGFSDGHETYVQFLSEASRKKAATLHDLYLSAMKPGFGIGFRSINKE
jgi:hypothetical protein